MKGLERAARLGRCKRLFFLVDNMGVTLAFARSRSSQFKILRQIRKANSYLLPCNSVACYRWLPSKLNSSDEPSYIVDAVQSKLLVAANEGVSLEVLGQGREVGSQQRGGREEEAAAGPGVRGPSQQKKDSAHLPPASVAHNLGGAESHGLRPLLRPSGSSCSSKKQPCSSTSRSP